MRVNFDRYLRERTADYSPRPWLLERIGAWLAHPSSRYLHLIAEPGAGKTAVAAQVVLASRGEVARQAPPVPIGSITAHHFCSSKDAGWIDPLAFSRSVSKQLTESLPGFKKALTDSQRVDRTIIAAPQLHIEHVEQGGQVTGVQLMVQARSPQSAFTWDVRAPLDKLYNEGFDRDVVILIDALDEARLAAGETIFDLIAQVDHWPSRVRFLVTSRPEQPIIRALQERDPAIVSIALGSGEERERSREDVRRYVAGRTSRLAGKLAAGFSVATLGDRLATKADGNFLWAVFAMSMLASLSDAITAGTLAAMPSELSPLYFDFIQRLARNDRRRWFEKHALVLGTLVVAEEAMTDAELSAYSGVDATETTRVILDLTQLLDKGDRDGLRTWSIYHRSFIDFLLDPAKADEYVCDAQASHRRIVDTWLGAVERSGTTDLTRGDQYARQNIAAHLFALRADEGMRTRLLSLVSREWMNAKVDHTSFARDVALAAEAAVAVHPAALVDQIRATGVLAAVRSRAQAVPAQLLATMARLGNVDAALSYLTVANSPEATADAAVEIAAALLDTDAAAAERVLRNVGSTAAQSTKFAALRASALAALGRFDDVMPLVPVLAESRESVRITERALAAGRLDVAEAILAVARGFERAGLVQLVVDAALAQGDRGTAYRLVDAGDDPQLRVRVARAFRAVDVAVSTHLISTLPSGWQIAGAAALVGDAAADSDAALESTLSKFPEADAPAILDTALTAAADCDDVAVTTRLAKRAGIDATGRIVTLRAWRLLREGRTAELLPLSQDDRTPGSFPWFDFAKHLAARGDVTQVVSAISHIEDWRVELVLDAAVAARDTPEFVIAVLDGIGDRATVKVRKSVASALVTRGYAEAALAMAAAAPMAMKADIIAASVEAAIDADRLDDALRMADNAPEVLASLADRLTLRLVDAARLDDALRVAPARISDDVRACLIDRLADSRRTDDAVVVASGSTFGRDLLLQRLLLRDVTAATLAAVDRESPFIDDIVERVEWILEHRGARDAVARLRSLHSPRTTEGSEQVFAGALSTPVDPDAARRALDVLAAKPSWRITPAVVASVAAALHVLPFDEAVAAGRRLSPRMDLSPLLVELAFRGDARTGREIVAADDPWFLSSGPTHRAIQTLAQMGRWNEGFQIALACGDEFAGRQRLIADLLAAAGWNGDLAAAAAAAQAHQIQDLDFKLSNLADHPNLLSLRIQAVALLDRYSYKRRTLVDDLVRLRQFARAAHVAREHGDLLATVLSSSVLAGTPVDISSIAINADMLDDAIDDAARALLSAGRPGDVRDLARQLSPRSWRRRSVAEQLVRTGHVDLALEVATTADAARQDDALIAIAMAIAPTDDEAADRILRRVGNPGQRVAGVAAVIEALLAASKPDRALALKRASTLLPASLAELARVAAALLNAGQDKEAAATVDTAVRLASVVEDSWRRDMALYDLARLMVARGLLDRALAINDLLPSFGRHHAWVAMDVAIRRASDGDMSAAIATVTGEIASLRQSSRPPPVRDEAALAGLLIALRGWQSLHDVIGEIEAAPRPNHSILPFVFTDLTRHLDRSHAWRSPPRAVARPWRWWRRRRLKEISRSLLTRAAAAAAHDADEQMRAQAHALIATRYLDFGYSRQALDIIGDANRALRWPPSTARIFTVSALGFVHQRTGNAAAAGECLHNVVDALVALQERANYDALRPCGTLLGATGAAPDVVERLVGEAVRNQDYRNRDFVAVLTYAADGDAGRAERIGAALARAAAAAAADDYALGAFASGVIECGAIARSDALLQEAWTICQRLDTRASVSAIAGGATRFAEFNAAVARRWANAALGALPSHPNAESIPQLRAQLATTLLRTGADLDGRRELATALDEVRSRSRDAFFAVLAAWIALLRDDPRLPSLADALIETERWWTHRTEG